MTGAQEKAYARLLKQHRNLTITQWGSDRDDIGVTWTEQAVFGSNVTKHARITPEGRVVEQQ
jgi:hypothetical protein